MHSCLAPAPRYLSILGQRISRAVIWYPSFVGVRSSRRILEKGNDDANTDKKHPNAISCQADSLPALFCCRVHQELRSHGSESFGRCGC